MNDKKAAEALATLHAAGLLRGIWVPDQTVRDRRQLVAQRWDRVRAVNNGIESPQIIGLNWALWRF
jgi:hypothetical protein